MNRSDALKRLTAVFQDVFDDSSLSINDSTTSNDIEDWDSIEHITLISSVENEFKMTFKMREVSGMKNVGEMLNIICERAKKRQFLLFSVFSSNFTIIPLNILL